MVKWTSEKIWFCVEMPEEQDEWPILYSLNRISCKVTNQ